MELKKCKCGKFYWKPKWKNNECNLLCVHCGTPYPSPDNVIREAIEFVDDKDKHLIKDYPDNYSAIYYVKRVDGYLKNLKQILGKWDQGRE